MGDASMLNPFKGASFVAIALTLAMALAPTGRVSAQATPQVSEPTSDVSEIVVTASRLARAGFDAPTPTTVLSNEDLLEANRVSIGEALADSPQFRAEGTP